MYLEQVLAADEQILETAQLHWVNYLKQWFFAFFWCSVFYGFFDIAR